MDSRSWKHCPILFIPASLLWVCINALCEYCHLAERLSKRYGWNKAKVEKWQYRITVVISLVVTYILIIIISKVINYNLFDSALAD